MVRRFVKTLTCHVRGQQIKFRTVGFEIDPTTSQEDQIFTRTLLTKARSLNAGTADPGGRERKEEQLIKTRYLGVVSEILLQQFLQDKLGDEYVVLNQDFVDYASHVDLEIHKKRDKRHLTVEVRGSYPYSDFTKVICQLFDIIGPYQTRNKPGEIAKDVYLRTLINQRVQVFDPLSRHSVFFVGGAESELFDQIGYNTDFDQYGARYQAIKPIAAARDVIQIMDVIQMKLHAD